MKPTTWSIILSIAALLYGTILEAQAPSILESKVERHETPPPWLSAEAVADAEKIIDLDLINSYALRMRVEKQQRALGDHLRAEELRAGEKPLITSIPFSECKSTSFLEDHRGGAGSTATLSDLAVNSKSILRGTIQTIDVGFDWGSPASLLGVEVSEVVKGPAPKSLFYVTYPVARFKIGPFYFCNANTGFEPRPGDEILLFDYTGPVDRDDVLYVPRFEQIFFQGQSGILVPPTQLKNTSELETIRTLDDVVSRLRSKLDMPKS